MLDCQLTYPNLSCQYANEAYVVAIRPLVMHPGERAGALEAAAQTLADETAITETLLGGGDTDTNACIVGGLIRALQGVSSIPNVMTQALLVCDMECGFKTF